MEHLLLFLRSRFEIFEVFLSENKQAFAPNGTDPDS